MVHTAGHEPPSMLPPGLCDIRQEAAQLGQVSETVADKRGALRPWDSITGICLHQTACLLGERPGRWASLGAHVGITRQGKIVWVHNFDRIVYHAQGWNSRCVGVEIDGRYCGVEGRDSTFWRPDDKPDLHPHRLTDESVQASSVLIRWVCKQVERHGGKVKVLCAHRQSSPTRRSDPGSAIWQRIALPLSRELELSDGGPGFKIGGRAIPTDWDKGRPGVAY